MEKTANLQGKPDAIEIKKEDITSDDETTYYYKPCPSINNIPQIKTEPKLPQFFKGNSIKVKTEDDSSDELSDHFIETCTKIEELPELDSKPYYANSIDDAFFDRDYAEVYIKEDNIDVEEHKIKLETIESNNEESRECDLKKAERKFFKCTFCTYQTQIQSSFKKHATLHSDPSTALLYFCTKCTYRTRQKAHLKRHDLVHQNSDDVTKYECAICTFRTKQKCTLKRHIDSVHANGYRGNIKSVGNDIVATNELLKCNECSYTTHKKGLLISHLDKHKDIRNVTNLYICEICSFSTKYRRNLRVHLETHKESPQLQIYECKLCSFKSRLGYCLKRHLLSKKHLLAAGKIEEYCPRTLKL